VRTLDWIDEDDGDDVDDVAADQVGIVERAVMPHAH
jgi:hypothetical protein